MNSAYRLLLILVLGVLMATCQKDINGDPGNNPNPGNNPSTVPASVAGRVIDEFGEPVAGAVVKGGNVSTSTNINGEFKLSNAQLISKAAYVTVNKPGYFEGSRTFIVRQGHQHYVEIQLVPKIEVGTIIAGSGGTITLGNGTAITLPANGVVTQSSGAAYTGPVSVHMAWIDPTSRDLFRQMPGDLRGTDANNNEVAMESYGMIGVELTGSNGEKLQIATGKKATLKFPLPSTIQNTAPASIALWSFDASKGLWKQEGTAAKNGSVYIAEVSHFSWWNCDIAINTPAYFSATFVDQNGQPLKGYHVVLYNTNNTFAGAQGYTDSTGYIGGRIPANVALQLKVWAPYPCNSFLHTENIGPFALNSTTALGNITVTLSAASYVTITGIAQNCNGAAITDGFVEIKSGFSLVRQPIVNGSFTVSIPNCAGEPVTYYVVDKTNNQQSTPVTATLNAGTTNVGTISACGVSTVEFIHFSYDGQSFSINDETKIRAFNSQGTPALWILGSDSAGTSAIGNNVSFFIINNGATGSFPLVSITGSVGNVVGFQYPSFRVNHINVNVTADGGPGGFIEGSFSGAVMDSLQVSHTLQCNFRARRE